MKPKAEIKAVKLDERVMDILVGVDNDESEHISQFSNNEDVQYIHHFKPSEEYFKHKEGCIWGEDLKHVHITPRDCYVKPSSVSSEELIKILEKHGVDLKQKLYLDLQKYISQREIQLKEKIKKIINTTKARFPNGQYDISSENLIELVEVLEKV